MIDPLTISLGLSAARSLIGLLQTEKRPPTDEEVEKLDADIAADRDALVGKLRRIADGGQDVPQSQQGEPDFTPGGYRASAWSGRLQDLR